MKKFSKRRGLLRRDGYQLPYKKHGLVVLKRKMGRSFQSGEEGGDLFLFLFLVCIEKAKNEEKENKSGIERRAGVREVIY